MHVKASMRLTNKESLSEHEAKRCRAMAKRRPWEVWEEDILWWSPDRQRWQPLEAESLPRRRRWLIVDTEDGPAVTLIWDVGEGLEPLPPAQREPPAEEHPGKPAEVR